jgi:uncharacterized protein (TIGR03437 family)
MPEGIMIPSWHCLWILLVGILVMPVSLVAQDPNEDDVDAARARIHWLRDRRANAAGEVPNEGYFEAHKALNRMLSVLTPGELAQDRWTFIGPQPAQALTSPQSIYSGARSISGRVTSIAIDPRNGNVVYLGSATGGVWKTTDGGVNWSPLTDTQPTLITGAIALDPSNPDTVYVGTGELLTGFYGGGVLKSTDGGSSWTQLAGPFIGPFSDYRGGAVFGSLAVSPAKPGVLLAGVEYGARLAARGGIYRSSDGGVTWSQVLGDGVATDIVFDSANPDTVYAGLSPPALTFPFGGAHNGVYKSSDAGLTWTQLKGAGTGIFPAANLGRISLALARTAPEAPNTLYAAVQDGSSTRFGNLLGMYRTTDSGATWTRLSVPDFCAPQCWYSMPIAVHPTNQNLLLTGGLFLLRSLNGGATWSNVYAGQNGEPLHADLHAIAFPTDASQTWVGTDGGVFVSTTITQPSVNWTDRNDTLGTIQFYPGISIHPTDPNFTLGGTQDNGTILYSGSRRWDVVSGGDGAYSAIDFAFPAILYASTQDNGLRKLGQSGYQGFVSARHGIDLSDRAQSITPFVMDPGNPQRLYDGTFRIYQTNDGAGLWRVISPDLTGGPDSQGALDPTISSISPSPASSDVVYAATANGKVWVTPNANLGPDATWVNRTGTLPARPASSVVADPIFATTAYVAYHGFSGFGNDNQGHIFKTTDGGSSWTDISANLPNVPVNVLVVDPDTTDTLYAGTDIGVFVTRDAGVTWGPLVNGLPRVIVLDLVLHRPSRILRAATHGRGMWDLQLPGGMANRPFISSLSKSSSATGADSFYLTLTGTNFAPGSEVRWNGAGRPTAVNSSTQMVALIAASDLTGAGRATISVFSPVPGGGLSNAWNFNVGGPPAITVGGIIGGAGVTGVTALSPGSTAVIYGTDLAYRVALAGTPPLPRNLGGVTVDLDGYPVPLLYVSPTSIVFQVPWEFDGQSLAHVVVFNGVRKSAEALVALAAYSPAIFTTNQTGTGQGAITLAANQNILMAPEGSFPDAHPAKKGEVVSIFATGLGPVSDTNGRLPTTGSPQSATSSRLSRIPTVTIGGAPCLVRFAGLAAGRIGVYKVDVEVPQGATSGNAVPVQLATGDPRAGTFTSNTVTMAIQ